MTKKITIHIVVFILILLGHALIVGYLLGGNFAPENGFIVLMRLAFATFLTISIWLKNDNTPQNSKK
jgi:hypothetical protein